MEHPVAFLEDVAVVLVVAAVTGAVARRLRQPAILGYLTAGLIVGPAIPVPLFADPTRVQALAEFGVVLVMFAVGLEFRVSNLLQVLPRAGFTTLFEVGVLAFVGSTVGRLVGLRPVEQVFFGASVAISSTMVVSRILDQRRVDPGARELVFGILVVQDVVAVVMLAILTGVATGRAVTMDELAFTLTELAVALLGMGLVGMLVVPRFVRGVLKLDSPEATTVALAGVAFGLAAAAIRLGYSPALGAFLAGVLVAEAGDGHRMESLIRPLRDVFAAIFFVSIGMVVDPMLVLRDLPAVLLISAVVIGGQLVSVTLAGVLSGNGLRSSVTAGLSLGQVGEFGFLIAALGVTAGAGPRLIALVVGVALITTFTTPLLIGLSESVVHQLDARAPRRLQRVLAVYEAWFDRLRRAPPRVLRSAGVVALDVGLLSLLAGAVSSWSPWVAERATTAGLPGVAARLLLPVAALGLAVPLAIGAFRSTQRLSRLVALEVVGGHRARAARRMVEASVQLLVLLAFGAPAVAVVRQFLGPAGDLVALLGVVVVLAAGQVWRRAGELHDDVTSGAAEIARVIGQQTRVEEERPAPSLPGIDNVTSVPLGPGSPAVGQTLAALDLRARTGASVIAIARHGRDVSAPTGRELLEDGDVLGVVGTDHAVDEARTVLLGGEG